MNEINFNPFPVLETDRLLLRRLELTDAPEVLFLRSDEEVLRYLNKQPATSIKEAEDFIEKVNKNAVENEAILWGMALKTDPSKIVGTICIWNIRKEDHRAEIGYALHPSYWRKGLTKEAILAIIQYGFTQMGLHSMDGYIDPDNLASAAILEATGFVKEAHLRENIFSNGQYYDTAIYSILNK